MYNRELPAEGEKEGKLKRLIAGCNLLTEVNIQMQWPHGNTFAEGSAKPRRERRPALRTEAHTGKKEAEPVGADSLGLSCHPDYWWIEAEK